MSTIQKGIPACTPILKKNYRLILVIALGIWIILLEVISKALGFTFYIIVTLLLFAAIGFSDVNKCASPKEVFINIMPSMILIVLFSVVAIFTNTNGLQLLGLDETVSGQAQDEISDFMSNAYTLALSPQTVGQNIGSWASVYLPMYIAGALVTVIGDSFDQKFAKASGMALVFMPVIIQLLGAFTGGLPPGFLGGALPDLSFAGSPIIESFMGIIGSAVDWLIAGAIVGLIKAIPEEEEGGEE